MLKTKVIMGMPILVEIVDKNVDRNIFNDVFNYFKYVDKKFSTYKNDSEMTRFNDKKISKRNLSKDMKEVLLFCEKTKKESFGYFEIEKEGRLDPSGLVKGWSIYYAAEIIKNAGYKNFYVDAGGDIQVSGKNSDGNYWSIGIQNPFNLNQVVKRISVYNKGVATSGTYIRGQHVYDPKSFSPITDIVSITVIGPNIFDADRYATAAFAMGQNGIGFIAGLDGFEGFMIDKNAQATYTLGFNDYVISNRG